MVSGRSWNGAIQSVLEAAASFTSLTTRLLFNAAIGTSCPSYDCRACRYLPPELETVSVALFERERAAVIYTCHEASSVVARSYAHRSNRQSTARSLVLGCRPHMPGNTPAMQIRRACRYVLSAHQVLAAATPLSVAPLDRSMAPSPASDKRAWTRAHRSTHVRCPAGSTISTILTKGELPWHLRRATFT
jgi:hypothetical protein